MTELSDPDELRTKLMGMLKNEMSNIELERIREVINALWREATAEPEDDDGDFGSENEFEQTALSSEDAINSFLDVVARPVGTQRFSVPESSETNRAILGLYDAVGRNL